MEDELSLQDMVHSFGNMPADVRIKVEVPAKTLFIFLVRKKSLSSIAVEPVSKLTLPLRSDRQPMHAICSILLSLEVSLEMLYEHIHETPGVPEEVRKMMDDMKPYAVKITEDANIGFCKFVFSVDEEARVNTERGLNDPKWQTLHRESLQVEYQTMVLGLKALLTGTRSRKTKQKP